MISHRGVGNVFENMLTGAMNLSTFGVYGDTVANATPSPATVDENGNPVVSAGSSDMTGYILGGIAFLAMAAMFFNNPQARKRRSRIGKARKALEEAEGMSRWF